MPWQQRAVTFPDVELLLTAFYRTQLPLAGEAGVYVSNAVPATRRDRMVIVRRDGGSVDGLRDRARVNLRVWDTTEQRATDLARIVQALAFGTADGEPVVQVVHLSGPSPVADESGQPLRLIVIEFHTRGVPA